MAFVPIHYPHAPAPPTTQVPAPLWVGFGLWSPCRERYTVRFTRSLTLLHFRCCARRIHLTGPFVPLLHLCVPARPSPPQHVRITRCVQPPACLRVLSAASWCYAGQIALDTHSSLPVQTHAQLCPAPTCLRVCGCEPIGAAWHAVRRRVRAHLSVAILARGPFSGHSLRHTSTPGCMRGAFHIQSLQSYVPPYQVVPVACTCTFCIV